MPPRLNIPPVTRILLIVLVVQSMLSAVIRYRQYSQSSEIVIPYLNLIPQLSLIYPWTFVTTTLVENNVFTLSIACLTLFHGGRYLERAWSSREFAKFLVIVAVIPNIITFAVAILFFSLTRNERWTLTTIGGTIPLQISFLIAFSQLVPAHTVTLFRGIISLRVPRFPLLYVGAVAVLSLTPLLSSAAFVLAISGFVTSWTYLRFYKAVFPDLDSSQPTSLRGDASETFAFAEFFPGPVKPLVASVSDSIFNVLVAMRLCVPFDVSAGGNNVLPRGAPGSARAEAERRRALALKALDQRLHAATANAAQRASQTPPPPAVHPPAPSAAGSMGKQTPAPQPAMTARTGETSYSSKSSSEQ